jgi:hypothetical protein
MEEATVVKCEPDLKNPWAVTQLEDFLFYCCPECNDRSQNIETFIKHALTQHSLAKATIPAIIEMDNILKGSDSDNFVGIKTELTTEETYDFSNEEIDKTVSDSDNVDPLSVISTKKRKRKDNFVVIRTELTTEETSDISNEEMDQIGNVRLSGISTKKRKCTVNDDDYIDNENSDDNTNSHMCISVSKDQLVEVKMEELYRINEEKKFECIRCLKIVSSFSKMCLHLKSHRSCYSCGKDFLGSVRLKRHESNCRKRPKKLQLQCQYCAKSFKKSTSNVIRHEKGCRHWQKPPKRLQCQYCAKPFKSTWKVIRHEKGCRHWRPS